MCRAVQSAWPFTTCETSPLISCATRWCRQCAQQLHARPRRHIADSAIRSMMPPWMQHRMLPKGSSGTTPRSSLGSWTTRSRRCRRFAHERKADIAGSSSPPRRPVRSCRSAHARTAPFEACEPICGPSRRRISRRAPSVHNPSFVRSGTVARTAVTNPRSGQAAQSERTL
jgi:hypothetical protein